MHNNVSQINEPLQKENIILKTLASNLNEH